MIFLVLSCNSSNMISEEKAHCLMHTFFAAFDGDKDPIKKLEGILDSNFEISSSKIKMTKLDDLKNYFSKRKKGDLYYHLPENIKYENGIINLDLDYQAWTEAGRKAMILEYSFKFENNKIKTVNYKFKKKISGSPTPMSSLEDNLKGCEAGHHH